MKPQKNAKKYLFSYLKNKPYFHNSEIFIYGSCARHNEKYNSDLDVLIVVDEAKQDVMLKAIQDLRYINDDIAIIDLKIMTKEKWQKKHTTFTNNIREEGINVTKEFRDIL